MLARAWSKTDHSCRTRAGMLICLLASTHAVALDLGGLLDDFDLNNYALGVATTVTQQPYAGVSHSRILYPFLTSVEDST